MRTSEKEAEIRELAINTALARCMSQVKSIESQVGCGRDLNLRLTYREPFGKAPYAVASATVKVSVGGMYSADEHETKRNGDFVTDEPAKY